MRHRFHSLCPYFAMFPEDFVRKNVVWADRADVVYDPFVGRGTTVFQSLLSGYSAIGSDINPVAFCVSRAKSDPPSLPRLLARLDQLELAWSSRQAAPASDFGDLTEFFAACFAPMTMEQVLFLRDALRWRRSRVDAFIAALCLGALHGESHRTKLCFSNRMPRTISTKPGYSVNWWRRNGCVAPARDVFQILRELALFRFASSPPELRGRVVQCDVRRAGSRLASYAGRVGLVITSPPYVDTTDYLEDQWLRIWFLKGPSYQRGRKRDDRHRVLGRYWEFLTEAWHGIAPLLRGGAQVVVRIGGRALSFEGAEEGLTSTLSRGLGTRVRLLDSSVSAIEGGQLHSFRPGASGSAHEFDFRFATA